MMRLKTRFHHRSKNSLVTFPKLMTCIKNLVIAGDVAGNIIQSYDQIFALAVGAAGELQEPCYRLLVSR